MIKTRTKTDDDHQHRDVPRGFKSDSGGSQEPSKGVTTSLGGFQVISESYMGFQECFMDIPRGFGSI